MLDLDFYGFDHCGDRIATFLPDFVRSDFDRMTGSQSYHRDSQRQRCKNLQRSAFL
jgi:hypothetical protein